LGALKKHTANGCTSPAVKKPTPEEFRGAFLRLMERYGGLDYMTLSRADWEQLELLRGESAELHRWDQDVLHDWTEASGVPMGQDAYRRDAPIIYMARRMRSVGLGDPALAAALAEAMREIERRRRWGDQAEEW
jgi:hypothetical protein